MCACVSHSATSSSLATLWTVAFQAPLSVGFPMQEFWSEFLALLQGIFPTQGSNLHCRQILYHLSQYRPDQIIPKLKAFQWFLTVLGKIFQIPSFKSEKPQWSPLPSTVFRTHPTLFIHGAQDKLALSLFLKCSKVSPGLGPLHQPAMCPLISWQGRGLWYSKWCHQLRWPMPEDHPFTHYYGDLL